MCALFIGTDTVPTHDNIKKLHPVLVSKNRIKTIIDFLLSENSMYLDAGVEFSAENLDSLFPPESRHDDVAVPRGIELASLPAAEGVEAATAAYANRRETGADPANALRPPAQYDNLPVPRDDIVMEAVGYIVGDSTPQDYDKMKASALAWCLDKKKYISMRSGSKFISDLDPGLLTFTFPRLDPWGIGGFHEPQRSKTQRISFEHQNDPSFAYVCWNIIQKKEVNRNIHFRTKAQSQNDMVKDVLEMAPLLSDLMVKWEKNDRARASSEAEKKAMNTLRKLKVVARDLKGSTGYKQSRINEPARRVTPPRDQDRRAAGDLRRGSGSPSPTKGKNGADPIPYSSCRRRSSPFMLWSRS
ncbi:hypothetical protein B0H10DRAFT_2168958 [Mycena sp. CBHHK59/15]|nr:hypothetical protein B0H10DRAFT_2168958 [Mycena sp. CBHHK59/15]